MWNTVDALLSSLPSLLPHILYPALALVQPWASISTNPSPQPCGIYQDPPGAPVVPAPGPHGTPGLLRLSPEGKIVTEPGGLGGTANPGRGVAANPSRGVAANPSSAAAGTPAQPVLRTNKRSPRKRSPGPPMSGSRGHYRCRIAQRGNACSLLFTVIIVALSAQCGGKTEY